MSKRRIVIDGYNLGLEKGTGIATYARNLSFCLRDAGCNVGILYGLGSAPDKTPLMREIAFYDPFKRPQTRIGIIVNTALSLIESPISRKTYSFSDFQYVEARQFSARMPSYDSLLNSPKFFELAEIYFSIFRRLLPVTLPNGIDVMHWTYPVPAIATNAKNIYTIHDLIPLRLPFATLGNKKRFNSMITKIVTRADHIVTVSERSAKDIITFYPAVKSKITNTYQSVTIPQNFLDVSDGEIKEEIEGLFPTLSHKRYLIFFGSIEPKKNVARMVEAFLAANVDYKLVIVGAQAWGADKDLKMIDELNFQAFTLSKSKMRPFSRIVQLNYVSYARLISLIRSARAILFPSLYEGFGIPPIEGMICGTPAIVSNTSCLPEICGKGSLYVDPYDVRDIKAGIQHICSDTFDLNELAQHWPAVLARFSAENFTKRIISVYDKVLAAT